uniref:ATPbinding Cassette (ABC) Superfamily putative n=1 Tax=Albugo laibachii Nc14 TaxID=890382 RepID=F0WIZ0_9STRA|nr:ATPbinding Cassette (ABC) Superfamily putative [Albugo laibachii Nc14]|eukprot:CCA21236.1 ATPbinding Cassette (ABC) Superfamily putative [Albugo laibachii Nc14]
MAMSTSTSTSTSTSSSLSFTSSFSSSSSSLDDYLTTVSSCFEQVLELDVAYGRCVMNSGVFSQSSSSSNATNTLPSELPSTQVIVDTIRNADLDEWNWRRAGRTLQLSSLLDTKRQSLGTCRLHCTNPSIHSSSACCDAGRRLRMCGTKQNELDSCKSMFDGMFPTEKYCGITSATIVLLTITVVMITLFGVLVWLSRTYHSKQHNDDIKYVGLNLGTTMENVVIAWKRITNQVWKNLLLRKRHPVKLGMELLLPVLLVGALTVIVNLDLWFSREARPSISATSTATNSSEESSVWCLGLEPLDIGSDTGVVTDTQLTFYSTGQSVLGLYLLLSYINFVSATVTSMVIEKESRIREIMRIMGLPPYTLLISWALTSLPIFTSLSFIVAAELKYGGVFPYAEYSTLVFLFWSLGIAIAAFAYCLTPFFNKSRTASVASSLIWLILFFPFLSVKPNSNTEKYFAAILPPTAFSLAIDSLVQYARLGRGLSYATAVMDTPITAPTAEAMSWILLLDAMLLYAFGWYFERVIPQQYGTPKPWNFLFTGRLRCPRSVLKKKCVDLQITSPNGDNFSPSFGFRPLPKYLRVLENSSYELDLPSVGTSSSSHFEQVDAALLAQERSRYCLKIINLRKVFTLQNGETRNAVKGLDLSMYSGHITALLGHNGAGKTTTISMLTGLLQPSSGDVTFNGQYLSEDLEDLRKSMGVCPQHDVLFSDLTVDEHLRLFGAMKCISGDELAEDIASLIHDIGLDDKTNTLARNLSGGQKRKLSIALAFIGRSKLVFLDEPTSGMDPHSRRFTWNLLRKNRQGRVIVLTTHFMDEADLLGDRIAIMVDGELRCVGSSFFLKKHFGTGYNLTATILPKYDEKVILQFFRRFIDDASIFSSHGAEVIFQLPSSSSGVFVEMLENLEASKRNFGILDYGISVSTLEEVFLRIAKDREQNEHIEDNAITNSMTDELGNHLEAAEYDTSSDQPPFHRQLKALLMKRIRITTRDKRFIFVLIGIPLVFLILLVSIPEINIAQFLSVNNYAPARLPVGRISEEQPCAPDYFHGYQATLQRCRRRFRYCSVGVIDCNMDTCCNFLNTASPYFACNTCKSRSTPCYNNRCLSQQGANLQAVLNSFLVSVIVVLAFTFIPASIVDFVVREKESDRNAKDLQLICGASIMSYWWSNLIHDVALASIPCICGIILVPLSIRTLHAPIEILGVAALITTHVAATIPMAYVFSFYFEQHARAQTGLIVFMLSSGCLLSVFSLFCRLIDFGNVSIIDRSYLRWIFLLFPGYSLNTGIHEIANRKVNRNVITNWLRPASPTSFFGLFDGLGTDTLCIPCWLNNVEGCCNRGVFDLDTAGASIIYAVVEAAFFTLLVFRLERRAKGPVRDAITHEEWMEDDDVAQERERVLASSPTESDAVFLRNIRQEYREGSRLLCRSRRTKVAIRDLCLAIPKGECFGYLGINGAGKSSTIRILTGQMAPTRGAAFVGQYDLSIESDRNKARSILGYCPQFDALHEYLTVEEQLELYARLKGVSESMLPIIIREKISQFRLEVYRSKLTRDLSGGNKRKVSTAIALINSPQVIILDEPSTGMDPGARRKMWDYGRM